MELEVLDLKANTESLDKAVGSINKLDSTIDKLEKTLSQLERSFAQSMKVVAQAQSQVESASKGAAQGLSYVQKQIDKTNTTLQGMSGQLIGVSGKWIKVSDALTKGQYGLLATAKNAGAAAKEVKQLSGTLELLNKVTGKNPFDAAMNPLAHYKNRVSELQKTIKLSERYNDLSQEQLRLISRQAELTRLRAQAEGANFGQREAAVKRETAALVEQMRIENKIKDDIAERNRLSQEQVRVQQEAARAAQVSAKQRADAEKYVQETLQRTLFMNEQMDKGMSTSGASALYAYKQQLDLLGLSADQAAAKMQEFQDALTIKQGLQGRARQIREDIDDTTEGVNQLARAVSVQLGDVFVSLAGGMNPLLVAIQQGDQIRFALEQARAAGQGLDNVMRGAFASMANSFVLVGTIVKDFLIDGIMSAGDAITNFNISVLDAIGRMVDLGNVATDTIRALEDAAAAGSRFSAAMVGVMNAARTLAGGLLLGIVAAIGTFAVASVKLSNDLDKLAIALNMSGASLGLTAQQAQQAAEKIGESYGTNIYDALDAVTLFSTKNIQFTDEMIVSATELSRVTGKSLSDIIDSYSSLEGKPVEGLLDVAIATGQVNIETIKQIDKLVEQGKTAEATKLAMQEKARAEQEAARNTLAEMTPLGRLWIQMKKDVSELGDAVYDLVTQSVLVDAFAVAWRGVASVFHVIAWAVKSVGKLIGGIAAQLVALTNLDFSSVMNIGNSMMSDAASGYRELEGTLKSLWTSTDELTRKELEAAAARKQANAAAASQFKKEYEDRKKGANEAGKEAEKTQKYFEKLMEGASDLALKTQQEVSKLNSGYEQMTNSQKMLFDAQNDPRWNSLSERQKAEFENALKLIAVNEELIRQYNAQVALQELLSKWEDDYDSAAISIKEEADALKLRNDLLFKTEEEAKAIQRQYDLNVKLAAVENKYIKRRNQMMMDYVNLVKEGNWSPAALEEYQRNMAAVAQQEAAERELAHKDANLKIVEDYEKQFREVQDTITDIVATALFEGGKAGSKKLKDVLKAEFHKYVINVMINPIVGNTMGAVSQSLGIGGQSGGAGNLLSSASNLQSLYGAVTGGITSTIGGAVGALGSAIGSSAVTSFAAGIKGSTLAAGLAGPTTAGASGAMGLGASFGAAIPWVAGGLLVADLLGAFDKKPSDKSSWATVDPTTGVVSGVGSMTGKKDPGQEQRDATAQLAQVVGQFAGMAGITSEIVTMIGQRDGIRVKIVDGWNTPSAGVANGGDKNMLVYGGIGDPETALRNMLNDLVDEGTLDQATIDTWRSMQTEVDGTTRSSMELISVLNLLTAGYEKADIERANLLQTENEALELAYSRMVSIESAIAGTYTPFNDIRSGVESMSSAFESLGVVMPSSILGFNELISGIDLSTESGKSLYATLMNMVPAYAQFSEAITESFGIVSSSVGEIFSNVMQESDSAIEASRNAAQRFSDTIYEALVGNVLNAVTEMVMSGVVSPLVTNLVGASSVAGTNMASGGIVGGSSVAEGGHIAAMDLAAVVEQAEAYIGAMESILSDEGVRQMIAEVSSAVGDIAGSMYSGVAAYSPTYTAAWEERRIQMQEEAANAEAARLSAEKDRFELYQQILTEEDRLAIKTMTLRAEFENLGFEMPETREGLKQLIDAQDMVSTSGVELKNSLIDLIPAFNDLVAVSEDIIATLTGVSSSAVGEMISGVTGSITDLRQSSKDWFEIAKEIQAWLKGERAVISNSLSDERADLMKTISLAEGGDIESARRVTDEASSYLEAFKLQASSAEDYIRESSKVVNQLALVKGVSELEGMKDAVQASLMEQQLQVLKELDNYLKTTEEPKMEVIESFATKLDDLNTAINEYEKLSYVDLKESIQLTIDSVVSNPQLPENVKRMLDADLKGLSVDIDFILGTDQLTADQKWIAINTTSDLVKTIDFTVKNPPGAKLMDVVLSQTGLIRKTIRAVEASNSDEDAKNVALATSHEITRTILAEFSDKNGDRMRAFALGQTLTDIQRTVLASFGKDVTPNMRAFALGQAKDVTRAIVATWNVQGVPKATQDLVLATGRDINRNIIALWNSQAIDEDTRLLATASLREAARWLKPEIYGVPLNSPEYALAVSKVGIAVRQLNPTLYEQRNKAYDTLASGDAIKNIGRELTPSVGVVPNGVALLASGEDKVGILRRLSPDVILGIDEGIYNLAMAYEEDVKRILKPEYKPQAGTTIALLADASAVNAIRYILPQWHETEGLDLHSIAEGTPLDTIRKIKPQWFSTETEHYKKLNSILIGGEKVVDRKIKATIDTALLTAQQNAFLDVVSGVNDKGTVTVEGGFTYNPSKAFSDAMGGVEGSVETLSTQFKTLSTSLNNLIAALKKDEAFGREVTARSALDTDASSRSRSVVSSEKMVDGKYVYTSVEGGKTYTTTQDTAFDPMRYLEKNKKLVDYFSSNFQTIAALGQPTNLEDYAEWHFRTYGIRELAEGLNGRKFATGGLFTNGVVSRPTTFNMGLMGEAGPEAIMPLTNVGGSLGVRAEMPSNDEMLAELRMLNTRIANLEAANVATARNTHYALKQLERWDGDGLPETRDMLGETDVIL